MTIATGEDALAADVFKIAQGIFGDGSDGDVTIISDTDLTRDMYYNNLTIASTKILSTKGFRIFVLDTLTNSGYIENNGTDGSGVTKGIGGVAGTMGGGGDGATSPEEAGGGGGGGGVVFISARTIVNTGGAIQANGGDGGDGIGTSGSGGGTPGSGVNPSAEGGDGGNGGSSGGAGGGAGGTANASVGVRAIFMELVTANVGGGGGGGCGGTLNLTGSGGGGGGGGGAVIIIYNAATFDTEECLGGTGGAFHTSGNDGQNGNAGAVVKIQC